MQRIKANILVLREHKCQSEACEVMIFLNLWQQAQSFKTTDSSLKKVFTNTQIISIQI